MKNSIKKGLGFGLTSGIITTLGLIIGLGTSTHNIKVVISGIFVIAFADSLSDALGVHISEETNPNNPKKAVWESTATTFVTKLVLSSTFIIPMLLLSINWAIFASAAWGILLMILFNYFIAKQNKYSPVSIITEHLVIAILVIAVTYFIGELVSKYF